MGHDHSHDDPKSYYVEQLCTIGITGALGGIAFLLWQRAQGLYFIAPKVQPWVLAGGVALLVLVVMRAVAVWFQAGRVPATAHAHDHDHHHDHVHGHDHSHGEACDHDHDHDHDHGHHHDHDHGHDHAHGHGEDGHTHGWAPWRYVILLLPVVLFFLGLPDEKWASADDSDAVRNVAGINVGGMRSAQDAAAIEVSFPELQRAPVTPEGRQYYEGRKIRIKGECLPVNDQTFTLVRYRMNCCAKDAVPLKAVIWVDRRPDDKQEKNRLPAELRRLWVEVEGQVHFEQQPDKTWMTIIVLRPDDKHVLFDPEGKEAGALIKVTKPDTNYYLY